jgi:MFS family permease
VTERPPSVVRLLVLAIMVVTTSTQPAFLLGAAFFQIGEEFGLGPVGLGALTSSFFLTASVASAPMGRWVQRVGWQRAMRVNTRASAIVMVLIAVLARDFWTMGGLLVLAACSYGISNPAANLALSDHADPRRRATVFGAKHAGIPASALLAGLAVPVVVVNYGWRWAIVGAALIAFGLSMLIPSTDVAPTAHERPEPSNRPARPPMSTRWLLGLATGSALATWAAIGLGTYLVSAALELGFSEPEAGWLQFTGSAISIGARIGIGVLTDRFGWSGFGGIVTLTGIGAVVFAFLPAATSVWFVIGVLVAYGTGWGWPGLMTFTVVNANRGSVASSSAITQAGVFVGAGAGPLLLGFVIDRGSYDAAWLTVALGLAGATAIIFVVRARLAAMTAAVRPG